MSRNILFVIDESEFKYFEFNDLVTDFWLIREFLKREYSVYVSIKRDLFLESSNAFVFTQKSYLKDENIFYEKKRSKSLINDFDAVFFRPDPPVDTDYINACCVFDYVDRKRTLLINDPAGVKNFNEKLHINDFPEFVPENIVTSSAELISEFTKKHGEAILKPLNRCFGSGVYYLKQDDKNLATIINNMTNDGKTQVMVQKYLDGAKYGDKRIITAAGEVFDECIQKLPGEHNFKFSIHADKYFKDAELTPNEKIMAKTIAEKLSEKGIILTGLDVINEKAIEINVTSPCCFIREINNHYGIHFEDKIMNRLEKLIENRFSKERLYAFNQ